MVHGNFGQEALESDAVLGGLAALALVLVDDQDSLPGPSQGRGVVRQGVLPLPRFLVIEDLLGLDWRT